MGKIVDEILLYFGQEFLAVKIKQADGESDQGKGKRHAADDPEIHFTQDIERTMREIQHDMIVVVAKYGQSAGAGYIVPGGYSGYIFLIYIFLFFAAVSTQFHIGQYVEIAKFLFQDSG